MEHSARSDRILGGSGGIERCKDFGPDLSFVAGLAQGSGRQIDKKERRGSVYAPRREVG